MENYMEKLGEVKIADDAILTIAAIAATDIKGIYSLQGDITRESVVKMDVRNLEKGIRTTIADGKVSVVASVIIDGSETIPKVTEEAGKKIKDAIEMMTGMSVTGVDIEICGVRA